jgi:RecA/RadA recombinase
MGKKTTIKSNLPASSFSELNDLLSKFSPDGAIIEDNIYAKIDEWIPTGSYILNAAMSGSLFGGMPNRRSLAFVGEESTGKTYLTCSIVRNAQAMGYFPIYYDTEGSIDIDFVKRLGIDTTKIRLENVSTIEEFATLAAKLNESIDELRKAGKTPPKTLVILDSLGSISSLKEKTDTTLGDNKRDMTKQQAVRRTFRVIGNDFAKNAIPFIICGHVYEKIGSYIPGKEVSGGGGIKYSTSIIFMLTKSKLEDKDSEEHVKKQGIEAAKVGIVVTIHPYKQRFARPIKVQIHIPFYKKPNPYVGLEKFVSWKNCGIIRGKMLIKKEYDKLSIEEQEKCFEFLIPVKDLKGGDDGTRYAQPKDTARTLVCKHLGGEIPLIELYTSKVFTEEVLQQLDSNIIKPTFQLPSIESLEDLTEATAILNNNNKIENETMDVCETIKELNDQLFPEIDV